MSERNEELPEREPASRTKRSWIVPVAVIAALLLLLTAVGSLSRGPGPAAGPAAPAASPGENLPPATVETTPPPSLTAVERRDESDILAAGPVDAPVGLVVFSDYQCGFCAKWSTDTLPVLMEKVDAGELRIEWRDVNVFGEASERAARAAYAAAKQGQFWEYHDALFAEGRARSARELTEQDLVGLAGELGLDTTQFTADMAADATVAEIGRNAQLGQDLGAYSTPAFILGGQPIVGAQPTQVFVDAFDQALAAG